MASERPRLSTPRPRSPLSRLFTSGLQPPTPDTSAPTATGLSPLTTHTRRRARLFLLTDFAPARAAGRPVAASVKMQGRRAPRSTLLSRLPFPAHSFSRPSFSPNLDDLCLQSSPSRCTLPPLPARSLPRHAPCRHRLPRPPTSSAGHNSTGSSSLLRRPSPLLSRSPSTFRPLGDVCRPTRPFRRRPIAPSRHQPTSLHRRSVDRRARLHRRRLAHRRRSARSLRASNSTRQKKTPRGPGSRRSSSLSRAASARSSRASSTATSAGKRRCGSRTSMTLSARLRSKWLARCVSWAAATCAH